LEPDLVVVGEACDGEEALRIVPLLKPDVVLMDIQMRRMDGITATRLLAEGHGPAAVLLSLHHGTATPALAASPGPPDFVGKHESCEVLLAAIRGAAGQPAGAGC